LSKSERRNIVSELNGAAWGRNSLGRTARCFAALRFGCFLTAASGRFEIGRDDFWFLWLCW